MDVLFLRSGEDLHRIAAARSYLVRGRGVTFASNDHDIILTDPSASGLAFRVGTPVHGLWALKVVSGSVAISVNGVSVSGSSVELGDGSIPCQITFTHAGGRLSLIFARDEPPPITPMTTAGHLTSAQPTTQRKRQESPVGEWRLPTVGADDAPGWEGRIRGLVIALGEFSRSALRIASREQLSAYDLRAKKHTTASQEAAAAHSSIDGSLERALRLGTSSVDNLVSRLAPGSASCALGQIAYTGSYIPNAVRIGTVDLGSSDSLPVIVPLLGEAGWFLDGPLDASSDLITNVVLRLLASVPAGRLRIENFDPKLTGAFGMFSALRDDAPHLMPAVIRGKSELSARLEELVRTVASRSSRLVEYGVSNFEDLNAASPRTVDSYHLVVVHNYPYGFDDVSHDELLRLVESATRRGVSFLVQHDSQIKPIRGVDPATLLRRLRRLVYGAGRWTTTALNGITARPDPQANPQVCARISTEVGKAEAQTALPTVDFMDLLPSPTEQWQPATRGIEAVVGLTARQSALISFTTSNPSRSNALIGGSAGQGKSNLLHIMIHAFATRYSPDDVEMYLLDFKQGIEFEPLGPSRDRQYWLPHIRVLGTYSDREFGLSVLRHIASELERRSDAFKRLGCTDIATLSPGPQRPPRILLVLDEFQILLAEDDAIAAEAASQLDHLVRQSRAYGIHVILATQSLQGISRLANKLDPILGQIPYRIVLKTTPIDSQSMLRLHNTAAADLQFRGQAILNDDFGNPEANRLVQIAYAEKPQLEKLRKDQWQRASHPRRPRIFEQNEPADLEIALTAVAEFTPNTDGSTAGWAGIPVTVDEQPRQIVVRPEPGAGLLLLGEDDAMALGTLTAVALPLALTGRNRGDRFMLLDLIPPDDEALAEGRDTLVQLLDGLGIQLEIVARSQVTQALLKLRSDLQQRDGSEPPIHILGLGMHRISRLRDTDPATSTTPQQALQELAADGPTAGMFLYGWWNRLSVCTDQLGFKRAGIGQYLFLRHQEGGIKEVCGPRTTWASRRHRGLLWDGLSPEPTSLVTFTPLEHRNIEPILSRHR